MSGECCTGCMIFTGGEVRHIKECFFYHESLTERYDKIEKELETIQKENEQLKNGMRAMLKTINYLNKELETTKKLLDEAVKVIDFYGKEKHWLGLTDKVPFDILKWIRIVEDDMDENNLGGKKARGFLAKLSREGGEVKERVLMHKESGELCVLTNKFWGEVHMSISFIYYNGGYSADWNDADFVELGFL